MCEGGDVQHDGDRKRKFEVPEGLSVFKDLYGQTMLKWDVGHVGSVLSPHMVGFMKPSKLRKKKRVSLLMLCITVLLTVTDTCSRGDQEVESCRSSLDNHKF